MLIPQKSGSSGKACRSYPWVKSGNARAYVSQYVCVRARECVRVCVCVGRSERGWKTHMNKREDKSFSCFSNILIFHECLFDVVLNIHVFYA